MMQIKCRLAIGLSLVLGLILITSAHAQAPKPKLTGDPIKDIKSAFEQQTGVKATGDIGYDLLQALDVKLLPDLQYAKKLADATGNKLTGGCWQAWIDMIQTQQKAVQNQDGSPIDPPDPHLITTFERFVDLRNSLQPESPFMIACSPVANLLKSDQRSFMA